MALINCPECNKRISNQAVSCPDCGFPVAQFFLNQKKEQARLQYETEISQKKEKLNELNSITIFNHSFSYSYNNILCIKLVNCLCNAKKNTHKLYEDTLKDLDNDLIYEKFYLNNVEENAYSFIVAIATNTLPYIKRFLSDEDLYSDQVFKDIEDIIVDEEWLENYVSDFCNYHYKIYKEIDLAEMNAHMQYHDDYYKAGTPSQPIQSFYANDFLNMIKGTISSKLFNSVAEGLTAGGVKRLENAAKNKYYSQVFKLMFYFEILIVAKFDSYVDDIIDSILDSIINYFIEEAILSEKYIPSISNYNYDNYTKYICSGTYEDKKSLFLKTVIKNPCRIATYSDFLVNIDISENDYTEVLRLFKFFWPNKDLQAQIKLSEKKFKRINEKNKAIAAKKKEEQEAKEAATLEKELNDYKKALINIINNKLWFVNFKEFLRDYDAVASKVNNSYGRKKTTDSF